MRIRWPLLPLLLVTLAARAAEPPKLPSELRELSPKPAPGGWSVSLEGPRYFLFGKSLPSEEAYARLKRLAAVLKDRPELRLSIEGVVEAREKAKGGPGQVQALAAARAMRVKEDLVQSGVDAERIALARSQPAAPRRGVQAASGARGVRLLIVVPESKPASFRLPEGLIRPGGYLRSEWAYRTASPEDWTKMRNLLYVGSSGSFTPSLSYRLSGRMFYDAVYDIRDNYPRTVEDDMEFEAELREVYLDYSAGDWDLRLGKQQIVWGEIVGLFVADVVNAKDLREFVLPEFDFIRVPQWAANAEITKGNVHAEAVFQPDVEFNRLGRAGSEFPPRIATPPGVPYAFGGGQEPGTSFKNSELGFRLSALASGWDLSAFHFNGWDKFPVYQSAATPTGLVLTPTYRRLPLTGATASKEVNDIVFKGELVYSDNKRLPTADPAAPGGLHTSDLLDYALGADYTFAGKVDSNLQLIQRTVLDYQSALVSEERLRTMISVWLKTGFLDNTLEPEILLIQNVNRPDRMIRPKVNYSFMERWRLSLGFDILQGHPEGLFGQYSNKDRFYTELKLVF